MGAITGALTGPLMGADKRTDVEKATTGSGESSQTGGGTSAANTRQAYDLSNFAGLGAADLLGNASLMPAAVSSTIAGEQPVGWDQISPLLNPFAEGQIKANLAALQPSQAYQRSIMQNQDSQDPYSSSRGEGGAGGQLFEASIAANNMKMAQDVNTASYQQALAAAQAEQQRRLMAGQTLGGEAIQSIIGGQGYIPLGGNTTGVAGTQTSFGNNQYSNRSNETDHTMQTDSNPMGTIGNIAGAAMDFAPLLFSDERVKENIKEVGVLHDGQKIYKYNYKGSPKTQVGLIAQDVAHTHPDAVGHMGGLLAVDYDKATRDAEKSKGGSLSDPHEFTKLVAHHFQHFHAMRQHAENGGEPPHRAFGGTDLDGNPLPAQGDVDKGGVMYGNVGEASPTGSEDSPNIKGPGVGLGSWDPTVRAEPQGPSKWDQARGILGNFTKNQIDMYRPMQAGAPGSGTQRSTGQASGQSSQDQGRSQVGDLTSFLGRMQNPIALPNFSPSASPLARGGVARLGYADRGAVPGPDDDPDAPPPDTGGDTDSGGIRGFLRGIFGRGSDASPSGILNGRTPNNYDRYAGAIAPALSYQPGAYNAYKQSLEDRRLKQAEMFGADYEGNPSAASNIAAGYTSGPNGTRIPSLAREQQEATITGRNPATQQPTYAAQVSGGYTPGPNGTTIPTLGAVNASYQNYLQLTEAMKNDPRVMAQRALLSQQYLAGTLTAEGIAKAIQELPVPANPAFPGQGIPQTPGTSAPSAGAPPPPPRAAAGTPPPPSAAGAISAPGTPTAGGATPVSVPARPSAPANPAGYTPTSLAGYPLTKLADDIEAAANNPDPRLAETNVRELMMAHAPAIKKFFADTRVPVDEGDWRGAARYFVNGVRANPGGTTQRPYGADVDPHAGDPTARANTPYAAPATTIQKPAISPDVQKRAFAMSLDPNLSKSLEHDPALAAEREGAILREKNIVNSEEKQRLGRTISDRFDDLERGLVDAGPSVAYWATGPVLSKPWVSAAIASGFPTEKFTQAQALNTEIHHQIEAISSRVGGGDAAKTDAAKATLEGAVATAFQSKDLGKLFKILHDAKTNFQDLYELPQDPARKEYYPETWRKPDDQVLPPEGHPGAVLGRFPTSRNPNPPFEWHVQTPAGKWIPVAPEGAGRRGANVPPPAGAPPAPPAPGGSPVGAFRPVDYTGAPETWNRGAPAAGAPVAGAGVYAGTSEKEPIGHIKPWQDPNAPDAKARNIIKTPKGWRFLTPEEERSHVYNDPSMRRSFTAKDVSDTAETLRKNIEDMLPPPTQYTE